MDVLAHMMSLMRTKGSLYGRLEFSAPFGFRFPADDGVCLIVTRGSCFLSVDDSPLVPVVGGDFVKSYGGEVRLAQIVDGYSTTAAIARMQEKA